MESKTEEQRRKPKRVSSDDDDRALRCKVLMGISAAGLKEQSRCMYVCVCACVCACFCVYERARELSAVLPLRNSNCDPCSAKAYSPLGPALRYHTHTQLLGLCCSGPMKTSHTCTSAVTLPALTPMPF